MSRRTGRRLGVLLIVIAALGALGIVVLSGDGDEAAPPDAEAEPETTTTTAPGAIDGPTETADGLVVEPVGPVPGATALAVVEGEVRATDATTGDRYTVATGGSSIDGPATFGSLSRLDRSVPDPAGSGRWVAESTSLHRIDDSGGILETVALDVPGAITAVDDDAIWLTVSGVPGSHGGGGSSTQSVVQRVDLATRQVVARPLDDPATFRFALGDDAVWVTVGRTLYRLDPVTLEPLAEAELAEPATALVVGDGVVMAVIGGEVPAVVRFSSDLARDSILLGPGSVGDATFVGDAFGGAPELWVLRPDEGQVARVELTTGEITTIDVPAPRRIELDDGLQVWLLSDAGGGTLVRVARPVGEE